MILNRMSDDEIDVRIAAAYADLKPGFFNPASSTARSNLVIIELLARLLEKDRHPCKCDTKPDDLPAKIVEALDAAELLIRHPNEDPIRGHTNQDWCMRFGNLSQEIRNELANREKNIKES